MKITSNLGEVMHRLDRLAGMLPAVAAAGCGGEVAGKELARVATGNYAFLSGAGLGGGAMKMALEGALAGLAGQSPALQATAAFIARMYGADRDPAGSYHSTLFPGKETGKPGVVLRAALALDAPRYRTKGWTFEDEDILGKKTFVDKGGHVRTRQIIREGAKRTKQVEYFPRGDQSVREAPGGEARVFGEELAADLERAREWIRDWVSAPEELGGKRTEFKETESRQSIEETVDAMIEILGIKKGQGGAYTAEMRAARDAILPHIQAYVDAYEADDAGEHGVPPEERMTPRPGDATEEVSGFDRNARKQWRAAILKTWRETAQAVVPDLTVRAFRAALRDVEWGKAPKRQLTLGA